MSGRDIGDAAGAQPADPAVSRSAPADEAAAARSSSRARFSSRSLRSPRLRLGAIVAVALAAGFVVWLLVREDDPASTATQAPAAAVSPDELERLAASVGHPVFWLGPKSGSTYELTRTSNGGIYIRYLPGGEQLGATEPYLTVATYPFPGAFPAVQLEAAREGAETAQLENGGLAVLDQGYPQSVHVAYPGVNHQVEVYDPTPARAMRLVSAGQLAHFGSLAPSATGRPTAASAAELKELATLLGHPIYWAGPRARYTYELTRTTDGKVYIRYLRPGVSVGDLRPRFLTVATYPFPGAFAAVEKTAQEGRTIELEGGGIGVVDGSYPKSVHVAFPGSDYQIEVYHPSPRAARALVASGRIAPVP
jgi:hypothetical protein